MPQFMCTMVAGLEEISKTEIEEKFSNAKNINTARGKVYFECKAKKMNY